MGDTPARCQPGEHDWIEGYYGMECRICGDFMPNVEEDVDEIPEHGTCEICGGEWGDGWSNCTCDDGGEGCDLCGEMVNHLRWTQDAAYLVCEVCWSEYPSGRLTQD